jgi:hypothetical protein
MTGEWTYLLSDGTGVYFDDRRLWAMFENQYSHWRNGTPISDDTKLANKARYASPHACELLELFEFQLNREVN